jgi:ABC-type spermidine/putrescine transport system permease subunit I
MTLAGDRWQMPRARGILTVARRRKLTAAAFLLPAVAVLAALLVLPLIRLVRLSFEHAGSVTFAEYRQLFTNTAYLRVFWMTFQLAAIVTVLCLLIGYPVAYAIAQASPRVRRWMMLPLLVGLTLSILARTYAWIVILQRHGLVNALLATLGLTSHPLTLVYNRFGVYVGMVHILLPFMVMVLLPTLRAVDPTLTTAARSLGAPPSKAFRLVFLPLSLPGVIAASTLVFVMALGFFITPAILGGGHTTTISMVVQTEVQDLLDWNLASAMAITLLAISLLALLVYDRFANVDRLYGGRA